MVFNTDNTRSKLIMRLSDYEIFELIEYLQGIDCDEEPQHSGIVECLKDYMRVRGIIKRNFKGVNGFDDPFDAVGHIEKILISVMSSREALIVKVTDTLTELANLKSKWRWRDYEDETPDDRQMVWVSLDNKKPFLIEHYPQSWKNYERKKLYWLPTPQSPELI